MRSIRPIMVWKVRARLAARLGERPEPGEVDMGVAGKRDRPGLRILVAQLAKRGAEHLVRLDGRGNCVRAERIRVGRKIARQLPEILLIGARRGPRYVIRGVGRPAEVMQRVLGRADQRRHGIMRTRVVGMRAIGVITLERNLIDRIAAEDLGELRHLRDEQYEVREIAFDPRDLGSRQARRAIRHAERQTRETVGSDRETSAGKRKARVVRVEAVPCSPRRRHP